MVLGSQGDAKVEVPAPAWRARSVIAKTCRWSRSPSDHIRQRAVFSVLGNRTRTSIRWSCRRASPWITGAVTNWAAAYGHPPAARAARAGERCVPARYELVPCQGPSPWRRLPRTVKVRWRGVARSRLLTSATPEAHDGAISTLLTCRVPWR